MTANPQILSYRRSPAQDFAADMAAGSGDAVALEEIRFQTQISIRAIPGSSAAAAVEKLLGASLPVIAGEVTAVKTPYPGHVLWQSPDEFLYVAADEAETGASPAQVAQLFIEAIGSEPGQAVDLTANRTVLQLSGPAVPDVLYKVTDIDVHPQVFTAGSVAVTLLASVGVVLWRTGEESWWVMPRASYAPHVVGWLLDAMREFNH